MDRFECNHACQAVDGWDGSAENSHPDKLIQRSIDGNYFKIVSSVLTRPRELKKENIWWQLFRNKLTTFCSFESLVCWRLQPKNKCRNLLSHKILLETTYCVIKFHMSERATAYTWHLMRMIFAIETMRLCCENVQTRWSHGKTIPSHLIAIASQPVHPHNRSFVQFQVTNGNESIESQVSPSYIIDVLKSFRKISILYSKLSPKATVDGKLRVRNASNVRKQVTIEFSSNIRPK